MHFSTIFGLAAGIASAQAVSTGFNYGNTFTDGTFKATSDYEAEFQRAKSLQGTNGEFTSARIYTMIQGGTTNSPTEAIQAAIDTQTTLLLGMWASVDQDAFNNEITALQAAISQYGDDFAKLVVGLSVGSEDLYRITPTGIQNQAGIGQSPDVLVSYIKQARSTIANTALSSVPVGHVDTWTAWVNGSNFGVTDNCDWLGVDSYPYFETSVANSITDANSTFWQSYDATVGSAQSKPVWVTETGWPVSGDVSGEAVASIPNAETYWQEVGCTLVGSYNTWYYTLQDAAPTTPDPSFGIVGSDLSSPPLYDLTCKKVTTTSTSSSTEASATAVKHKAGSGNIVPPSNGTVSGTVSSAGAGPSKTASSASSASGSASASASPNVGDAARPAGGAVAAGVLAMFGLVAAL